MDSLQELLAQSNKMQAAADRCIISGFEAARRIVAQPGGLDTFMTLGEVLMKVDTPEARAMIREEAAISSLLYHALAVAGWGRFAQILLEDCNDE